jgi:hypothetical protein
MQRRPPDCKRRLEQVGGVHRPARRRAGADHGVDLVDEEDGVRARFKRLDHLLHALFEIAAIARAGQQRAHIQRIDHGVGEHFGHVALDDLARQAFSDGGLADARIAHQQRVVLAAAAQHLDASLHLVGAADQRIDPAFARFGVKIDAIGGQRIVLVLSLLGDASASSSLFIRAARRPRFAGARLFGDAMGDEIHRVIAGHVPFREEVGGMAFALGEQGDQHIGAGHLIAAGVLNVNDRALNDALKAGGRLGVFAAVHDEAFKLFVDIFQQSVAQFIDIDIAGAHDRAGVFVFAKRVEQMLQRGVFMLALIGGG